MNRTNPVQNHVTFFILSLSLSYFTDPFLFRYPGTSKICGFHDGNHEECHPLGYKIPVRTSQETHYLCATETNELMLCKV
jgi:hypothetical protein